MVKEYRSISQLCEDFWIVGMLMFFGLVAQLGFLGGAKNIVEGSVLDFGGCTFLVEDVEATIRTLLHMMGSFLCFIALIGGLVLSKPMAFLRNLFNRQDNARQVKPIMAMRTLAFLPWTAITIFLVWTTEGNPIEMYLTAVSVVVLLTAVITAIVFLLWDADGAFNPVWKRKQGCAN